MLIEVSLSVVDSVDVVVLMNMVEVGVSSSLP